MVGLFDQQPEQEEHETDVLAYLKRFFRLTELRYDQLIVNVVGEGIISSVEVLGLSKSMFGLVPATMARDLGFEEDSQLILHFTEMGSNVRMVTQEPEPEVPSTPPSLIRRVR